MDLEAQASAVLNELQALIDEAASYPERVIAAKTAWANKTSSVAKAAAFRVVRATLAKMCVGAVRCAYCEDSMADEVEHIYPKALFPDQVFRWGNYAFVCGPCNGPKSNRYGVINGSSIEEFIRRRRGDVVPPPNGQPALIDPRSEDPTCFLELDLGGRSPTGVILTPTYEFLPADELDPARTARATFTIDVLGLNREILREARRNAFGGFRARLREYVHRREANALQIDLEALRDDLLTTSHLTVFYEMRRQRQFLPDINDLFLRAPEAVDWCVVIS